MWLMYLGSDSVALNWTEPNFNLFQAEFSEKRGAWHEEQGEGTEQGPLPSSLLQMPPEIHFILTMMVKTNSLLMQVEILSDKL